MSSAGDISLDKLAAGTELPELAVDVTATTVILGALATRDWRPMHHDKDFAIGRNGTRDIFLNTPNQAAWFERYLTDWSGPRGRLGRMKFRMKDSVFPGDRMIFSATVDDVSTDDAGCTWAELSVRLRVEDHAVTECAVRMALPKDDDDNPWARTGEDWKP
jgi:acyl dehydratase